MAVSSYQATDAPPARHEIRRKVAVLISQTRRRGSSLCQADLCQILPGERRERHERHLSWRCAVDIVGAIVHGKAGGSCDAVVRVGDPTGSSPAVGKQTRVEAAAASQPAGGSSVQRQGREAAPLEGSAAANIARRGTEGQGGPLPHHDRIQSLFGRHDLSGVFAGSGPRDAAVQRTTAAGVTGGGPAVAPPKAGIDKPGFIDRKDGANLHADPVQASDRLVRDQPLPPATRVFVSGMHPQGSDWWYVTAFLPDALVRGYVQGVARQHAPPRAAGGAAPGHRR